MNDEEKKTKFRFRHMKQSKDFGKHLGERKVNATMYKLKDLRDLQRLGMWQEYIKEANPNHTLEEMVDYYGADSGDIHGWVAFDKDKQDYAGFVIAVYTDWDLEPALLGTNVYIKPEYRLTNIDALLYDGIKMVAKMMKVKHICVLIDDMRVAKWVLRRYAPDNVVIFLERTI